MRGRSPHFWAILTLVLQMYCIHPSTPADTTCDCDDVDQTKMSLEHYMAEFRKCKTQRHSMKVMNYFLAKEVESLKDNAFQRGLKDEDEPTRDPNEQRKMEAASGGQQCAEELGKVQEDFDSAEAELSQCLTDKSIAEIRWKTTQMVADSLSDREAGLLEAKEDLEQDIQELVRESWHYQAYFLTSLLSIVALLAYLAKERMQNQAERQRQRKDVTAAERRERRGTRVPKTSKKHQ